jgi:putative transposase
MRDVTKNAPQQAIKNLGRAFKNFFDDLAACNRGEITRKRIRVPKFKKKGVRDRFRADNGTDKNRRDAVKTSGRRVKLPVVGWVKMREEVRFAGRIRSVVVSHIADSWYATFAVDFPYESDHHCPTAPVGVDLGIGVLATLSDGTKIAAPRPLRHLQRKLTRLSRALSRKRPSSSNRDKVKTKLARLHQRISNIRIDALHKLTTHLTRYATLVIEDLNVSGMLANRSLARATSDSGLREFRRQLEYKAEMASSIVIVANQWFASSRICSVCDAKNGTLALSERNWTCASCGTRHDRDVNAARNLARYPESSPGTACGAEGAGEGVSFFVKPAALNQEES